MPLAAYGGMTDGRALVDLIPDELSLARAQLAAGLLGHGRGRAAAAHRAAGRGGRDGRALEELDAARALLAEALWRQGRPLAGGAVVDGIRAGSLERRRPIVLLVEAEAMAAGGDPDRAAALMERVIESVGRRRGLAAARRRAVATGMADARLDAAHPTAPPAPGSPGTAATQPPAPPSPERTAAAHARLEAARLAYAAGRDDEGDRELGLALRLDPRVAAEGVALVEPTPWPAGRGADRLLLYGDLLRAAGRSPEASEAYDRAAARGLIPRLCPPTRKEQPRSMERTLVLVKPDGVQRGLIGEIIGRFERKGLKVVGLRLLTVPREMAERHYAVHAGKHFYAGPGRVHHLRAGGRDCPGGARCDRHRPPPGGQDHAERGRARHHPRRPGNQWPAQPDPRLGRGGDGATPSWRCGSLTARWSTTSAAVDAWIVAEEPPRQ